MIQLSEISLAYGGRAIFDKVTWTLGFRDRVGLVGANGTGKSTLIKMMAGLIQPDSGSISLVRGTTIGYLPQEGVVHKGRTLFNEAAAAFGDVIALQEEERQLSAQLQELGEDTEEFQAASFRYSEIQEHLFVLQAHQMEGRVEKVLRGLGFSHDDMGRMCDEFSGGWQMRIALSKLLLMEPGLLLLDEPTNYLDLEARVFLEDWLGRYSCALVLVAHDRYFMDRVVNRITEVFNGGLEDYHCSYTKHLEEREVRVERLRARAQEVRDERERITAFINRFRYKADKAAIVQSRIRQLEKLKDVPVPPERKKIHFQFPAPPRSGEMALEVEGLTAGYGNKPPVFRDATFRLNRGDKVPLVGVNGAGKTTMISVIAGLKEQISGSFKLGHNVVFDYFAQDIPQSLDPDMTVYETVESACPLDLVPRLRALLGAFLFSGDDIDKKVKVLSGGEKNRLALARMLLKPVNFLIMDEPTNHLDLESKEVLLDALKRFPGTVLYVSHDRHFLDNLSGKVVALENGELSVYPGGYPDFVEHLKTREPPLTSAGEQAPSAEETAKAMDKEERARAWEDEKRRKREKDRLEKLVQKLEESIHVSESKLNELDKKMALPTYAADYTELNKLLNRRAVIDTELKRLNGEWEDAFNRLNELTSFPA